jgi:hypothetical protein
MSFDYQIKKHKFSFDLQSLNEQFKTYYFRCLEYIHEQINTPCGYLPSQSFHSSERRQAMNKSHSKFRTCVAGENVIVLWKN